MTKKTLDIFQAEFVLANFDLPSPLVEIEPFGSGHINDTYLIRCGNGQARYLLQTVNSHVFKNVDLLMENIIKVTHHIRNKLRETYPTDFHKRGIMAERAIDGKYYYRASTGEYWRVFNFIENTRSYDIVKTVEQAFEGGRAFGQFQSLLSDLPATELKETISDFHNIRTRLNNFWDAVKRDAVNRVNFVSTEIELIISNSSEMDYFTEMAESGGLPRRIVHNDAKFNNLLLDQDDKAQCVIDLDTVMPGYSAYDFGDAVRSIVNTAAEDEKDIKNIKINLSLYRAFTEGYLSESVGFLEEEEINSLAEGAILFPYMQALRFLTDYLCGDHYYKIDFEDHNLQRTRAQLQLFIKLRNNRDLLHSIVRNTVSLLKKDKTLIVSN